MKDWTGNSRSYASTLGARNFALEEREEHDYYATDPNSLEKYLEALKRDHINLDINIWECACGEGHLSKKLEEKGYNVYSTDLIDRGYGIGGVDFINTKTKWGGTYLLIHPTNMLKSL